jgi:hypothetical protein
MRLDYFVYGFEATGLLLIFNWLRPPYRWVKALQTNPRRYYLRRAQESRLMGWGDICLAISNAISLFFRQWLGSRLWVASAAALFIVLTKWQHNRRREFLKLADQHLVSLIKERKPWASPRPK